MPQSLPVLVCSGLDDPLGNSGKGPSECFGDLEDRECSDLTIKLYPGDRHEILNETDKETVWADILEWINGVRDGKNEAAMYGMAVFPPAGGTAGRGPGAGDRPRQRRGRDHRRVSSAPLRA